MSRRTEEAIAKCLAYLLFAVLVAVAYALCYLMANAVGVGEVPDWASWLRVIGDTI